jgi:hypothetical protein
VRKDFLLVSRERPSFKARACSRDVDVCLKFRCLSQLQAVLGVRFCGCTIKMPEFYALPKMSNLHAKHFFAENTSDVIEYYNYYGSFC